jgi:uncharacterized protein (DUF488 family)
LHQKKRNTDDPYLEEQVSLRELLTIGYEGASIDDFIATLNHSDVEVLIDIRDVPVSRKRGFSKRRLAEILENAGLDYLHLRDLGDPKPGREAARRGDMDGFELIFRAHLARDASQEALTTAVEVATRSRAALLCFERDHACCHRAIVAEAMSDRMPFKVRHLARIIHETA